MGPATGLGAKPVPYGHKYVNTMLPMGAPEQRRSPHRHRWAEQEVPQPFPTPGARSGQAAPGRVGAGGPRRHTTRLPTRA